MAGDVRPGWLARLVRGARPQVYPLRSAQRRHAWRFPGGAAAVDESRSEALYLAQRELDRKASP